MTVLGNCVLFEMEIICIILAVIFCGVPVSVESGIAVSLSLLQYEVKLEEGDQPCKVQKFCNPKYQGLVIENSDEQTSLCPEVYDFPMVQGNYYNTTTAEYAKFTFPNTTSKEVFSYLNNLKICIKLEGQSDVIEGSQDIFRCCQCFRYLGPETTNTYSLPTVVEDKSLSVKVMLNTSCEAHYYGWNCSIFCQPTDNVNGHYDCSDEGEKICHTDYTGVNCTEVIDDCQNATCYNNGNCVDGIATYSCNCTESYYGGHCENKINFCSIPRAPCNGHGQCQDGESNYTCNCTEEYYGDKCQHHICEKVTCQHNGTCASKGNCICSSCYSGQYCGIFLDPCVNVSCHNGGSCVHVGCIPRCECPAYFTGNTCQTIMTTTSTTQSTSTLSSKTTVLSTSTRLLTRSHTAPDISKSTYSTTRLSRSTDQSTIRTTTAKKKSTYSTTRLSRSTDHTTNRTTTAQKATAKHNKQGTTENDKKPYIIAGAVIGGVVVIAVVAFVAVRIRKRQNTSRSNTHPESKTEHYNGVDVNITHDSLKSQNKDTRQHDQFNNVTQLQSNNNNDSGNNTRLSETSLSIDSFNGTDEPFEYNEQF